MGDAKCKHENWRVEYSCPVGFGRCLDCGAHIHLPELFNGLASKLKALIGEADRATQKVEVATKTEPTRDARIATAWSRLEFVLQWVHMDGILTDRTYMQLVSDVAYLASKAMKAVEPGLSGESDG